MGGDQFFSEYMKVWVFSFLRKNAWRVGSSYDFEDLTQEALLKWVQCRQKYPEVKEERHFFALYKKSLINHFHDLANKARMRHSFIDSREILIMSEINALRNLEHEYNLGMFNLRIREAPESVQRFLDEVLNPKNFEKLKSKRKRIGQKGKVQKRERLNDFFVRVLELQNCFDFDISEVDFVKETCNFLRKGDG